MEDKISNGYADELEDNYTSLVLTTSWSLQYIKKGKMRVVFDCSAQFENIDQQVDIGYKCLDRNSSIYGR